MLTAEKTESLLPREHLISQGKIGGQTETLVTIERRGHRTVSNQDDTDWDRLGPAETVAPSAATASRQFLTRNQLKASKCEQYCVAGRSTVCLSVHRHSPFSIKARGGKKLDRLSLESY
jgi:hypothetical protein